MTDHRHSLVGKLALVTGAGRGIGEAIAIAYAAAGARVACTARTRSQVEETAERIRADGGHAIAIAADVTDPNAVATLFDQVGSAFGGLDIVVLNAGGNPERSRIEQGRPEDWRASIELNLFGAYHCAREAIPHLRKRGDGKILMMGSGMGHRGMPGQSSYCVGKAGLWMLTRILAEELIEDGICVNEIIPGPVNTELTRADRETNDPSTPFAITSEWVKEPQDVTDLALFLACQPANGPTGQSYALLRRVT
jgi:3-oxoacyl-[acyl-carrier protein] reductase